MEYVIGTVISVLMMAFTCRTEVRENNKLKRVLRRLPAMIPLFLLSALRWDVGTDTWHTYTPEYLAMMSESRALTEKERQIVICSRAPGIFLYAQITTFILNYNLK